MCVNSSLSVGLSSDRSSFEGPSLRSTYEWLVTRMEHLGLSIDRIGINGPGFGRKYQDFARARARIASSDFNQVRSIQLSEFMPLATATYMQCRNARHQTAAPDRFKRGLIL